MERFRAIGPIAGNVVPIWHRNGAKSHSCAKCSSFAAWGSLCTYIGVYRVQRQPAQL
ncbi:hypothetical protein OHAE_1015 [Ochrobactrum soli]|uniref:Uncharacterized protein n=1 Tax=Ochrobactrum soli TaxID=2448455 RepID=A0A2P9HM18_9HYPH|nr:hypothetical protein OHAE_1015 [[Ochrobactrum] soli]